MQADSNSIENKTVSTRRRRFWQMQLTTTSSTRRDAVCRRHSEAAHESTTHSAAPLLRHLPLALSALHATLSRALHSEQALLLRLQRLCLHCSLAHSRSPSLFLCPLTTELRANDQRHKYTENHSHLIIFRAFLLFTVVAVADAVVAAVVVTVVISNFF